MEEMSAVFIDLAAVMLLTRYGEYLDWLEVN